MSMNFRSSIALSGIFIFVLLASIGWIFGPFPIDWYQPTNTVSLLNGTLSLLFWAILSMGLCPSLMAIQGVSVFAAFLKRPKRFTRKLLLILFPLMPALLIPVWGSYWWHHPPDEFVHVPQDYWSMIVLNELFLISSLFVLVIAIFVAFSKRWQGNRIFAFSILFLEFVYIGNLTFMAAMPVSNTWL